MIKDHIPASVTTIAGQRNHIATWAREFKGIVKNPMGYTKLVDGSWDFDVLMDMLFSFWVLKPIPEDHPKKELLRENGITFSCTCPHYNHYQLLQALCGPGALLQDHPGARTVQHCARRQAQGAGGRLPHKARQVPAD